MVTDVVFSRELQSQPRSDDDDVIAEAVWTAIVKLGAAEELDGFLMERSSRYGLLDLAVHQASGQTGRSVNPCRTAGVTAPNARTQCR